MNLEVLEKGNELKRKIEVLEGRLSTLDSIPYGAMDLNIMGDKRGRRELVGCIILTSDALDPSINKLLQKEFNIFKDNITAIIADELRDTRIEFENLT